MIGHAASQYGGLDFAFNNAGLIGSVAGIVATSEEDWHSVMATNLTGVWLKEVHCPIVASAKPPSAAGTRLLIGDRK